MKPSAPEYVIEADACLIGGGATDFTHYLAYKFPEKISSFHISVLEAVNCLAACRAFLTKEKHSSMILLRCDNIAAMESFNKGAARDPYLAAISRAMWFCMARADIKPLYQYTPGHLIIIPDALSCSFLSAGHYANATEIILYLDICPKKFYSHYLDFHDFL